MADSSFFKNNGTTTQLQTSASASAAAALASEQAALTSQTAAATSETNAAASAAASATSAAQSLASSNNSAASESNAATSEANALAASTSASSDAASASADATQTAADRVQTGLDRIATSADAVQTAADRVQTGLDVTSSSASAAAALSSRNAAATSETNAAASAASSSADATATASDRVQTSLDAASTASDALATAADRVQTGLDATSASNSASAASTSASAASASQVSAAASAASAAAVFNDFEDRYYGPHASDSAAQTHVTGLGLTVDQGDLYFNSTANEMRVYDGGSWIAASSAGGASLLNYNYTATASQTAFSGSDDNSNTLSYTVDNLIVTRNGVVLEDGTDYTATDGSTITLAAAAAAGDEINVVAFKSFTTADMVSATNGGTFQGNVDFAAGIDVTGNVTVTGTVDGRDVAADGTKLDGIEAGADVTDTANVTAAGAAMLTGANFTGNVDVTGTVTADGLTVDNSGTAITITNGDGVTQLGKFSGDATNGFVIEGKSNNNLTLKTKANTLGEGIKFVDTSNNNLMFIDGTTGNVGIGTSSPSRRLHVEYTDSNNITGVYKTATVTNCLIAFSDGGSTQGEFSTRLGSVGDELAFYTFGSNERMRIDNSGNVGIGTTPDANSKLHIREDTSSADKYTLHLETYVPQVVFQDISSSSTDFAIQVDSSVMKFLYGDASTGTNLASEAMRINNFGSVLVGDTGGVTGGGLLQVKRFDNARIIATQSNSTSNQYHHVFINNSGSLVGNILVSTTSTAFTTSSDYRLKENVVADWDATTRLKQLNPVRFNFIADADTTVDGFLAHEVQDVVPEAISGTKDAMMDEEYEVSAATGDIYTPAIEAVLDEDGNEVTPAVAEVIHSTDVEQPEELAEGQQWRETTAAVMGTRSVPDYQGIDQSKLVPLLVKTIQELEARITALETA